MVLSDSAALELASSGFRMGFSFLRVRGGGSHKFFTPHDYRADWPSSAGHLGEPQFNKYLNKLQCQLLWPPGAILLRELEFK